MILVVGLGNPGARYADTRHNIGFRVVEALAERCSVSEWRAKFSGELAQGVLAGERLLLLKPLTFMNRSGHSVQPAAAFYKLAPHDILVVHDELDLPFGQLRLKQGGGEAGNNGLRSITAQVGSPDYVRLRFGIGRPGPDFRGDGADYVLQAFAPTERVELDRLIEQAVSAVELVVRRGLSAAMNEVNRKR